MSEVIKPIILDETGRAIVEAITNSPTTQARIAEINAAAEAKKAEVLASIPSDYSELATDVRNMMVFVTPEMYGAVGDGEADDSNALQLAINSGQHCVANKNYRCTTRINIGSNTHLTLNGHLEYVGTQSALRISGEYIKIDGMGSITSSGTTAITNDDDALGYAEIDLKGIINCSSSRATSVIYLADTTGSGVSHNNFHDLRLFGGSKAEPKAAGIFIYTKSEGYVNENIFDNIYYHGCSFAIRMVNNSLHTINNNRFLRCETENSNVALKAVCNGKLQIIGNTFEFRTQEWTDESARILVDDKFIDNKIIVPNIRTCHIGRHSDTTATAKTLYVGNTYKATNSIVGDLQTNSGSPLSTNASFYINGDIPVYDYPPVRTLSSVINDSEFRFDYNGEQDRNYPAFENYLIGQSLESVSIDLNYISNWCSCPLKYIEIQNEAGTNVSIINGTNVLFTERHLDYGIYRCFYNYDKSHIRLVKMDFIA